MLQNFLPTSSPLSPLSSPLSPPTAEPTVSRQNFSSSSSNPPDLPSRPKLRSSYNTHIRPRSLEPVGFRSPALVSQRFDIPPTPPATNATPTTLSGADQEEEEDFGHEGVSLSAADQNPSAPGRTPPPPPLPPKIDITPAQSEPEDMPFKLPQQQKREGPSPRHKPTPVPVPRYQASETPVPSTLSRAMGKEGIVRPASANANPIPAFSFPPSPPLTRRSTVVQSVRSSTPTPKYAPSLPPLQPSKSLAPTQEGTLLGRPSTASSSSSVSVREVTKLGKALGRQPIDYLIPYGALDGPVSDNFHPYQDPHSLTHSPKTELPVADVFGNLNYLLDSYLSILSNGGSMAVGTGYRSVARKLLQQVGGVFNREVGVEGIDWSDILEYIRGDDQKPCLCVLPVKGLIQRNIDTATILSGAEPSEVGLQAPQQTKELAESVVAGVREKSGTGKVQEWLEEVEKVLRRQQPPPSPTTSTVPEEIEHEYEDEVVTQIIEGILPNPAQIEVFRSYLADQAYLASTKVALTRLYPQHPAVSITRPIVALYLLLHVELHPMLTAIGGLSDAEMELINSGRFDGFLDGSTNAVPRDEEEELGCISDLHKKLAHVMYTLDDELAELHNRALIVRQALKERRDAIATRIKKKIPESEYGDNTVVNGGEDLVVEDEDEQDDLLSPLMPVEEWDGGKSILLGPDDSASNVHFSRRRREARQEMEESEKKRAEKKERKELKRREEERRAGRHEVQEDGAGSTTVSKRRKEKKGEKRERRSGEGTESGSSTKRGRSGRRGEGEEQDAEKEKKEHKEHKERKDEHRERKEERESRREERESRREEREREPREKDKKDKSWSRALGGVGKWVGEKAGEMGAVALEKERKG
ncbi:hypothetical protein L873DRAFT_1674799 [Choiromyces venosus 120613-1]|uniref:Uncharacterized protein n=1 Tax=Choiromyces venosus 120613-1 TaxID=1336337 RepID=A0A3N4JUC5_9PEZI|nr:hypothetical protein L873DRAFT_1674799 [Choiromyces venosus 120613-1]